MCMYMFVPTCVTVKFLLIFNNNFKQTKLNKKKMSFSHCNFKGCNSSFDGRKVKAALFPVEDTLKCIEWIKATENPQLLDVSTKRLTVMGICHKHFEESSYLNTTHLILDRDAVPVKKLIRETFALPEKCENRVNEQSLAAEEQNGRVKNNLDEEESNECLIKGNGSGKSVQNGEEEEDKCKETSQTAEEQNKQNGDVKNGFGEENKETPTTGEVKSRLKEEITVEETEEHLTLRNNNEERSKDCQEENKVEEKTQTAEKQNREVKNKFKLEEEPPAAEEENKQMTQQNSAEEEDEQTADVVELKALDIQLELLRRENLDLKNRVANHLSLENNSTDVHKPSKKSKAKKNSHSHQDKLVALRYFFRSPSLYSTIIDDGVILPRLSTVHEWLKISHFRPGLSNKNFMQMISRIALTMNYKEKQCVFSVQEIHVKKQTRYNEEMKIHEGVVDLGEFTVSSKGGGGGGMSGNRAVVFAVHSLYGTWLLPVAYFISNGFIKNKILKKMILQAIQVLTVVGLEVNSIVCDFSEHKKSLFKELHVSSNQPSFESEKRAISAVYDMSSVKRAICETIMHHPHLVVTSQLHAISWNDFCAKIRVAVRHDYSFLFPKISNEHFTEVSLAEKDMFTENNAHNVLAVSHILDETKGENTAIFLKKLTLLFKCLTDYSLPTNEDVLREAKTWLDEIQVDRNKITCFEALAQTVEGILHVWDTNRIMFPSLESKNFTLEPISGLLKRVTDDAGAPEVAVDEFRESLERVISDLLKDWVF